MSGTEWKEKCSQSALFNLANPPTEEGLEKREVQGPLEKVERFQVSDYGMRASGTRQEMISTIGEHNFLHLAVKE